MKTMKPVQFEVFSGTCDNGETMDKLVPWTTRLTVG